MAEPLVQARGLTKKFGDFVAVDAIDFDIAKGEAFGFLGPNGAGKTSTMKMITTVSPITDGKLTVFGLDPDSASASSLRKTISTSSSPYRRISTYTGGITTCIAPTSRRESSICSSSPS